MVLSLGRGAGSRQQVSPPSPPLASPGPGSLLKGRVKVQDPPAVEKAPAARPVPKEQQAAPQGEQQQQASVAERTGLSRLLPVAEPFRLRPHWPQQPLQQGSGGAGQQGVQTLDISSPDGLHPVLELLERRMREGSRPGRRTDGCKLGLAVEGGGMRGIVTGAMLVSLLGHDTVNAFDAVYGASAGAMNSTYFLTRQPEGLNIYTDHLISERFLSIRRWWAPDGPPAMDLDHLLEDIMGVHCPLDWHGVVHSEVPLKIVASSLDSLQAELFADFTCPGDLRECLAATARVPGFAGPPRTHRGHRLVDGAVFEPIPVKSAVRDGCTHVLALRSTSPDGGPMWGRLLRMAVEGSVKRLMLSPDWMRDAWRAEMMYRSQDGVGLDEWLADVAAGRAPSSHGLCSISGASMGGGGGGGRQQAGGAALDGGVVGGSYVLPVHPSPGAPFALLCQDVRSLVQGRKEGFEAMEKILVPLLAPRPRAR